MTAHHACLVSPVLRETWFLPCHRLRALHPSRRTSVRRQGTPIAAAGSLHHSCPPMLCRVPYCYRYRRLWCEGDPELAAMRERNRTQRAIREEEMARREAHLRSTLQVGIGPICMQRLSEHRVAARPVATRLHSLRLSCRSGCWPVLGPAAAAPPPRPALHEKLPPYFLKTASAHGAPLGGLHFLPRPAPIP